MGYGAEQIGGLDGWLCGYDLVVNTVPAPVLGETELKDLRPDCLIIDLASKPGGVDLRAPPTAWDVRSIWALSLPGKVAPVTAGGAIRSTIYQHAPRAGRVISGKEGCNMEHKTVGFAVCGSFCTHAQGHGGPGGR